MARCEKTPLLHACMSVDVPWPALSLSLRRVGSTGTDGSRTRVIKRRVLGVLQGALAAALVDGERKETDGAVRGGAEPEVLNSVVKCPDVPLPANGLVPRRTEQDGCKRPRGPALVDEVLVDISPHLKGGFR